MSAESSGETALAVKKENRSSDREYLLHGNMAVIEHGFDIAFPALMALVRKAKGKAMELQVHDDSRVRNYTVRK